MMRLSFGIEFTTSTALDEVQIKSLKALISELQLI